MSVRSALLASMLALIFSSAGSADRGITVITGATVIDCTGRPPIRDAVIVIEGERIKAVGRKGEVRPVRGARVVDATGKYIMPGLIDMHVHYREWQGELFLAHGVTSVKDLGNPVEWISDLRRMQIEDRLRAPKIFYVGNNLDAPPPEGDHNVGVASARASAKAVRLLLGFGVSAIKVRHKVTAELLREITKAAHAAGVPVTGHLGATNARDAALAGIDGLEHAAGVARAAADAPDEVKIDAKGINAFIEDLRGFSLMKKNKEAALIKLLVEKRVKIIPTLGIRRRAILEGSPATLEDDRVARNPALAYVPERVRKDWSDPALDKMIRDQISKEDMQLMREGYGRLEQFVREFRRAGGVVLAGSDNLNGVAGLTLHRELEGLAAAGLAPMDVLIAATRDAARFLGREDIGTIEPGKAADLLILGASPLDSIRNLSSVEKVFQSGRDLDIGFHRDYALPPARPSLVRPLLLERLLAAEN